MSSLTTGTTTFQAWFDDMEERYHASYSGYEELLEEAWEHGAKTERERIVRMLKMSATNNSSAEGVLL